MNATGRWGWVVLFSILVVSSLKTPAQEAVLSRPAGATTTNLTSTPMATTRKVSYWQAKKRSPHQTEWQSVSYRTNAGTGKVTASTNSYIELGTGLNYFDPATQRWEESKEEIEIVNGVGVARRGQHKVTFAANINTAGAIQTVASDSKTLKSHVLGLAYTDAATGQSVLIAAVQDSIGEVAGNQVIYRDAFDGPFKADLRYTYTKGGFEQDVIFRQAPPAPEEFGMDPFTARIEVWTEFMAPPQPAKEFSVLKVEEDPQARAVMVDPDLTDETLNFGAMRIGTGTAFALEDQPTNTVETQTVPVGKDWLRIEGRDFLIEKVDFQDAAPSLDKLPAAEEANAGTNQKQASLKAKPRSELLAALSPPGRNRDQAAAAPAASRTLRMTGVFPKERGFVLDYSQVNTPQASMVFKSTETYHVTAPVTLTGTTRIEGGTVVKFNSGTYLTVSGAIACNTEPYRPAYFTARDDNSVGEIVAGSTGVPSGYYAGYIFFLSDSTTSYDLRHLRLRYATQGFSRTASGSGAATVTLRHSQIQDCNRAFGVYYSPVTLRNVLVYRTQIGFYSTAATYGDNVTFHRIKQLVTGPSQPPLELRNALLISCTNNADVDVAYVDNGGSYRHRPPPPADINDDSGVFETSALGQHYLPDDSLHRGQGVTTIDANLLSDLKQTTTRAPILLSGTIAESRILGPDIERISVTTVDRGYAYPAMDYLAQNCIVQGTVSQPVTLLITNGAVVGMDPTVGAAGAGRFGIQFGPYSDLISMGAPDKLNRLLPVQLIQENGPGAANWPSVFDTLRGSSIAANAPSAHLRFTDLSLFAGTTHRHLALWYGGFVKLAIQDSQVRGGTLNGLYLGSDISDHAIALTNTLFEGVQITHHPYAYGSLQAWNNLFKGGALIFDIAPTGVPLPVFYDNLFDKVAISQAGGRSVNGDYNAYVETTPTTTRLQPVGGHDRPEMSASPAYEIGPFGSNYLPATATQLINQGSRTASEAGLYHQTTSTIADTKDGTEPPSPYKVNIGLHYVAANSSNQPTDQDGDGLADYLEDKNGNGTTDFVETNFQDSDTDYDGRSDWQESVEDVTSPINYASAASRLLGYWRFNDSSWKGESGQQPLNSSILSTLANPTSWSGKALGVNNASAANLKYRDVEPSGFANINCRRGTARFWFKPDWTSGVGPGGIGRLIEIGDASNPTEGWWALSFNATGTQLKFETAGNGIQATHVTSVLNWTAGQWHQIALCYDETLSKLFVDGVCVASGIGVQNYPTRACRSANGFNIGSNRSGTQQAKGTFEELETFNYVISTSDIAEQFINIYDPVGQGNVATALAGRKLWLRADLGVTVDGQGRVYQWNDQSGQGNHAVQTGESARPSLRSDCINGQPALHFDGNDFLQGLSQVDVNGASSGSWLAIIRPRGGLSLILDNRQCSMIWHGEANRFGADVFFHDNVQNTDRWIDGTGGPLTPPEFSPEQTYLVVCTYDGTAGKYRTYVNGQRVAGLDGMVGSLRKGSVSPLIIGANASVSQFLGGDLAEVMVFDRALSEDDQLSLAAYARSRYGVRKGLMPPIVGQKMWLRADTGVAAYNVGGFPGIGWMDQSGYRSYIPLGWVDPIIGVGSHVSSMPGFSMPQYIPAGINGKPTVRFNQATLRAAAQIGITGLSGSWVALVNPTGTGDGTIFFNKQSKLHWYGLDLNHDGLEHCLSFEVQHSPGSSFGITSKGSCPPNRPSLVVCTFDGASGQMRIYVNGQLMPFASSHTSPGSMIEDQTGPVDEFFLGAEASMNQFPYIQNYFVGDMAEVVVLDHAVSDTERYEIERYIDQKYALGFAEGVKLWLQADKGIAADASGKVSQWADQSGNGNHFLNASGLPSSSPLVKLSFNETSGTTTANSGTAGGTTFSKAGTSSPAWSANVPPNNVGGARSVDYGTSTSGTSAVDSGAALAGLNGLASFTISGWLNNKSTTVGGGGNRVVSWCDSANAAGVDLVYNVDANGGYLQIGVNQWASSATSPIKSSSGKIPMSSSASLGNWRFFAVTYDYVQQKVSYYFGDATTPASVDVQLTYSGRGAVGGNGGRLAVGNLNAVARPSVTGTTRMFRGVIDEIHIYGSVLSQFDIVKLQQGAIGTKPVLVSSAVGGKPAVRFDGMNDSLNATGLIDLSGNISASWVVVVKSTAVSAQQSDSLFRNGQSTLELQPPSGGNPSLGFGVYRNGATATVSAAFPDGVPHLIVGTYDAATRGQRIFVDGLLAGQVAGNGLLGNSGTLPAATLGGDSFNGDIAEFLVFDHMLSFDQRRSLGRYLANKYGLTLATDSDGDGLSDDWETQYGLDAESGAGTQGFGGDPDGDGVGNLVEMTAKRNPRIGIENDASGAVLNLELHTKLR